MVNHISTSLPECGPTEYPAPEPWLFANRIILYAVVCVKELKSTIDSVKHTFKSYKKIKLNYS